MRLKEWIDAGTDRLSQLARSIKAQPQLVWQWVIGPDSPNGRRVPQARCPAIERATGFSVTCEEMRSDLHWVRVADPAWPRGKPLLDFLGDATSEDRGDRRKRADRRTGVDRRSGPRRSGESEPDAG